MALGWKVLWWTVRLSFLPSRLPPVRMESLRHEKIERGRGKDHPSRTFGKGPVPPAAVRAAVTICTLRLQVWLPTLLLHTTVTFGDTVSALRSFLMQPACADGDGSVHAVVEKLREENRLLKQKVTHVSVC